MERYRQAMVSSEDAVRDAAEHSVVGNVADNAEGGTAVDTAEGTVVDIVEGIVVDIAVGSVVDTAVLCPAVTVAIQKEIVSSLGLQAVDSFVQKHRVLSCRRSAWQS